MWKLLKEMVPSSIAVIGGGIVFLMLLLGVRYLVLPAPAEPAPVVVECQAVLDGEQNFGVDWSKIGKGRCCPACRCGK